MAVGRDDHDTADRPGRRRTLPGPPLPDANPDATLEGSTGWYDCDRDPNTEGEQVLLADSSLAGAQTRLHGHGVVSDRALTPTEWAQVVGQHWARSGTH